MLGAVASGDQADLRQAMETMSTLGETYAPQPDLADWHERRFAAFKTLQGIGRSIRDGR
jgi:D-ribulokinase